MCFCQVQRPLPAFILRLTRFLGWVTAENWSEEELEDTTGCDGGPELCQSESRGITVQALPKHTGGRQKDKEETRMDGAVWEGRRNQVSTVEMKSGRGRVLPGGGSAGVSVGFSEFEA